MRTELFADDAKEFSYVTGEKIRVATTQGIQSTRDVIALNVAGSLDIYDEVEVGHTILIDDGKLGLKVIDKDIATRQFIVEVENDGIIAKQKVLISLTLKFLSQHLRNATMLISVLVLNKDLTLLQSHLFVQQKTLRKFVKSVAKLVTTMCNYLLRLKTNKVSIILMKSSKLLMVS